MKKLNRIITLFLGLLIFFSCAENFLTEEPKDEIYADNLYVNYDGFKNALNAIYSLIRSERGEQGASFEGSLIWKVGTDSYWANYSFTSLAPFDEYGVSLNPTADVIGTIFDWLYDVVNSSNMIINRAENPDVDWQGGSDAEDEANKNLVIAHAKLFRAWAYRHLTYSWGDVPLSLEEINGETYKTGWTRTPKETIWTQMEEDLLFAESQLPDNYSDELILPKAVAQHYLAELYLAKGENSKAEQKALAVTDNPNFALITERYGVEKNNPGVPFMDQFKDGNALPSQGNTEALWVFLNQPDVKGGGGVTMRRTWVNRYYNFAPVNAENGGRGIGRVSHTYWLDNLYEEQDDRYSQYAIRKYYIKTNGDIVYTRVLDASKIKKQDMYWPSTRKWDYIVDESRADEGAQFNDMPYLRLAETYLLLAEAQLKLTKTTEAAEWINKIRLRSNASPIEASQVTLDFILEERSRELLSEEHRRHTLNRLGLLVERAKAYNPFSAGIKSYNELFPIPQNFLDTNTDPTVTQNPGYN
jgi:hypothetical protein